MARKIESAFFLQHTHDGVARRHDRRLRVFCEHQVAFGAFPHQARQLLLQRLVDLFEDFAGARKGFGERFAHADSLTALPRKNESARHRRPGPKLGGRQIKGRTPSQADAT